MENHPSAAALDQVVNSLNKQLSLADEIINLVKSNTTAVGSAVLVNATTRIMGAKNCAIDYFLQCDINAVICDGGHEATDPQGGICHKLTSEHDKYIRLNAPNRPTEGLEVVPALRALEVDTALEALEVVRVSVKTFIGLAQAVQEIGPAPADQETGLAHAVQEISLAPAVQEIGLAPADPVKDDTPLTTPLRATSELLYNTPIAENTALSVQKATSGITAKAAIKPGSTFLPNPIAQFGSLSQNRQVAMRASRYRCTTIIRAGD